MTTRMSTSGIAPEYQQNLLPNSSKNAIDDTLRNAESPYEATKSRNGHTQSGPDIEKVLAKRQIKCMTSIEQAKDRAQVTAATSMSVVHVALLKDLLDAGPDGHPYYKTSLGFVCAALVLQIIAGFVSLYIALLRFYFTEYRDDFLDDCMQTCCPLRCRRIKSLKKEKSIESWLEKRNAPRKNVAIEIDDDEENKCCPYTCKTARYADYEYHILDLYNILAEENIKADLMAVNYEIEDRYLVKKIDKYKTELKYLKSEEGREDQIRAVTTQLEEALQRQDMIEEKEKNAEEFQAQSAILGKYVERIQEERVLKRATFWQNWLNMMMYTVFILNALIAGFGLAHPNPVGQAPALSVSMVTQSGVDINSYT